LTNVDGLLVQYDFLFFVIRSRIAALAVEKQIPAVYENEAPFLRVG
jgi:hypothetical protein